jgi:L-seryl-tRNA(Ser) seleniumtransferase
MPRPNAWLPAFATALGNGWQAGIKPVRGQIGSGALPVDLLPSFALSVKARGRGRGPRQAPDAFRRLPIR